jgi:hypothetical protein
MDSHKNARLTARSRKLLARRVVEQGVPHGRDETVVEMQVGAAGGGSCNLDKRIMRIQQPRIRHGQGLYFAFFPIQQTAFINPPIS